MTTALKEIHLENEKKRDANVKFVSLIRESDPKLAHKKKLVRNKRLLIGSDQTSENSLVEKYKDSLAENILSNDVDIDIDLGGKFIGETERILLHSKNEPSLSSKKEI